MTNLMVLFYFLISVFQYNGNVDKQDILLSSQKDNVNTVKTVLYNPKIVTNLPKTLKETSGLIFWRNGLWTINDSGGKPVIYKVDVKTGKILQQISIAGAVNKDWEALTQDEYYIYVGDVGNNRGKRHKFTVYKIKKNQIPKNGNARVIPQTINFDFPDKRSVPKKWDATAFDCEAILSWNNHLYVFTKDWKSQHTRFYRIPKKPGNYKATFVGSFDVGGLITAATGENRAGNIILLGYTKGDWIPFIWALSHFKGDDFFSGKKVRVDMPQRIASQTEGVAFTSGWKGYISAEETSITYPVLFRFDFSSRKPFLK